jgi:ATP-dependent DNA helicase PIF1
MENSLPFGGKVMIMGGDFRQCLQPPANRSQQINTTLVKSEYWPQFQKLLLTENMRTRNGEKGFASWLLKVGNGELNDEDGWIEIPSHYNW